MQSEWITMTKTISLILLIFMMTIFIPASDARSFNYQNKPFTLKTAASDHAEQSVSKDRSSEQPMPVNGKLLEKGTRKAIADTTLYIRKASAKDIIDTVRKKKFTFLEYRNNILLFMKKRS